MGIAEGLYNKIEEFGIIPVVKIMDAGDAVDLGKALIKGGLPIAEITFRTTAAEDSIKKLHDELPEILLGAGTVLTVNQVKKAAATGAEFIVAPGFNPEVVDYCIGNNIPVIPGVNSPTQIEMALTKGLTVLKYFPAEASGGLSMLNSMAAPYGGLKFVPTGGINSGNLTSYLTSEMVLACGGTWMVKPGLISSGNFREITRITREAVTGMLGFEFSYLGINEESGEGARASAQGFASLLLLPVVEKSDSFFAGDKLGIMKSASLGTNGHIAIGTNSMKRAIAYFKRNGIGILSETIKEENGRISKVYLEKEISGFAVCLVQK